MKLIIIMLFTMSSNYASAYEWYDEPSNQIVNLNAKGYYRMSLKFQKDSIKYQNSHKDSSNEFLNQFPAKDRELWRWRTAISIIGCMGLLTAYEKTKNLEYLESYEYMDCNQ